MNNDIESEGKIHEHSQETFPYEPKEERHVSQEKSKTPSLNSKNLNDFDAVGVTLIEDTFAQYYDESGDKHAIKRFTWKNKNKIQVQVINYGAKVISIKLPDRKGEIEDVLLGFDDLAGYLFYEKYYFGSVLGRVSNSIKNSTFAINNKKYIVNSNMGPHCNHGGNKGFDKVIWDTFLTGKKVIMSHVSPHLTEGFPGDLLVRVEFELSAKNEFKVGFEAQTTHPTYIDLSQLLYFNLAGHHSGPDEIYRHVLTLNCNCFTPQVKKIPTGEILNVIHTQYDFQIPKVLGKVIGITPKDGLNQNLCVNRGMYQDQCFVGRLLHPPSGRMLEVYSNQPGVQLNTGNEFGYGNILSFEEIMSESKTKAVKKSLEQNDNTMLVYQKVHDKVVSLLKLDEKQNFDEIKQLIWKFNTLKSLSQSESMTKLKTEGFKVTSMQKEYLEKAKEIVCENEETDDDCLDLKDALSRILNIVKVDEPVMLETSSREATSPRSSKAASTQNQGSRMSQKSNTSGTNKEISNEKLVHKISSSAEPSSEPNVSSKISNEKEKKVSLNKIPSYYQDSDQIRGKGRALYKTHGGISLQTQNYPNAVNINHFPNCLLNPGEIYKHDIVYRFWIRAGNPNKWIKRNLQESKQKFKQK